MVTDLNPVNIVVETCESIDVVPNALGVCVEDMSAVMMFVAIRFLHVTGEAITPDVRPFVDDHALVTRISQFSGASGSVKASSYYEKAFTHLRFEWMNCWKFLYSRS